MRVSTGAYHPELVVSKLVSSYFYTKHIHNITLFGVFRCARALRTSFHVKTSLNICGLHKFHNFTVCRKLNLCVFVEKLLVSLCLDTKDNHTRRLSSKAITSSQGHSQVSYCKDTSPCTVSMGRDCDLPCCSCCTLIIYHQYL